MGIQSFLFIIIVSYHKHIYSLLNPHFWHSQCCHNNRHYELVDIALFTNCSISCCCYEPVVPFKNWNCFWLVHLLPHWLLWSGKGFGGEKQINQKRPRERLLSPAENRPSWLWQAQFYQATSNTFPAYPPPPLHRRGEENKCLCFTWSKQGIHFMILRKPSEQTNNFYRGGLKQCFNKG